MTIELLSGRRWKATLDELIDSEREFSGRVEGPWERWKMRDRVSERVRLSFDLQNKARTLTRTGRPTLSFAYATASLTAVEGQPSAAPSSFTAVNTTITETNLWTPAIWAPIPANSMMAGKVYQGNAGGVLGTTLTPTLVWTPRSGQSATPGSNVTLGPTTAATMIASLAAVPWAWQFNLVIRALGLAASGATGTGSGQVTIGGLTTATGVVQVMGGTVATTIDNTAATGLPLSVTWGTSAAANTVTAQWVAPILSLN